MSEIFLKPFSDKHSIREAAISLFLVNPIIKPERFRKLIENGFEKDFHLYENVNALQIQFKPGANANAVFTQPETQPNVGFKFLGFQSGKIGKVLQGTNEISRTFISYHSLMYDRWAGYLNDYLKYLKVISDFQPDIFVKAFSVHYVDEFNWVSNSVMDLNKVFNYEAKYMSKAFLEFSQASNFIYSTEKLDESKRLLNDRLEIKVDNKVLKNITISHNITEQFDDFKNLTSLLSDEEALFKTALQELHNHNKRILNDILIDDVKKLIHLPTEL